MTRSELLVWTSAALVLAVVAAVCMAVIVDHHERNQR